MQRKLSNGDIRRLHQLATVKDRGVLTSEEFAEQKAFMLYGPPQGGSDGPSSAHNRRTPWVLAAAAALVVAVGIGLISTDTSAQRLALSQPTAASTTVSLPTSHK